MAEPPTDCPFCGAECVEWDGLEDVDTFTVMKNGVAVRTVFIVECGWCHAHGPHAETRQQALDKWNDR